MRLVMTFTAGDGCTYSCDEALPIEYESAEAALVDFERACLAARASRVGCFLFADREFDTGTFFWRNTEPDRFDPPDFLTVDEWFNQAGVF